MRPLIAAIVCLVAIAAAAEETIPGVVLQAAGHAPAIECEAHVATAADEKTYRCGEHFPSGNETSYAWLQVGNAISAFPAELPARTALNLSLLLSAGGRVAFDGADATTRIFAVRRDPLHPHFERRAAGATLLPAGKAVAIRFDRHENATAISPPIETQPIARQTPLAPPKAGSDLLVVLEPPQTATDASDIELAIAIDGVPHPADVIIEGRDTLHAIWYALPGREAQLVVRSPLVGLPTRTISLAPRDVTTVRAKLQLLPSIDVSVAAPTDTLTPAEWAAMSIDIRRVGEKTALRTAPASAKPARIASLPLESLQLVLHLPHGTMTEHADLTPGSDRTIVFHVEPITVSGVVYHGRDPEADAVVAFRTGDEWIKATTDSGGRYTARLWEPTRYLIETTLANSPAGTPAFSDLARILGDETRDIHIPRSTLVVSVTDAATQKPISGASVTMFNRWQDPVAGRRTVSQAAKTDAAGLARLPPLRPGTVDIHVRGAGYEEPEMITRTVGEDSDLRVTVALKAVTDAATMHIVLPNGLDAAGADIAAIAHGSDIVWSAAADARGDVEVPRRLDGSLLLVRHPTAGSDLRVWNTAATGSWQLPPRATPLVVTVERPWGERATSAVVAIIVNDVRLSAGALAFFARSSAYTDLGGVWIANGLPPRPLRFLAGSAKNAGAIAAGAFDTRAETIAYPWSSATVKSVD